jgi:(p)ppGpp synthase/HD superfamily hydrolase
LHTSLQIPAQINIQLYQQLQEDGYSETELERIRRVYEFVSSRFAGRYQSSGRPFLCHLVGTASVVARVTRRPALAAAGLVHSVHRTKESRDGSREVADSLRQPIIEAIGAELERYALGFFQTRHHYDVLRQRVGGFQPFEADVATLLLCDDLEKLSSRNVLYSDRPEERIRKFRQKGPDMVALARELGLTSLAEELTQALEATFVSEIPRVLRQSSGS